MATKVDEMPRPAGGRPRSYPWDEWLDGDVWRLVRGEDFDVAASSLISACRPAAKARGVSARTRIEREDGSEVVYLQARPEGSA